MNGGEWPHGGQWNHGFAGPTGLDYWADPNNANNVVYHYAGTWFLGTTGLPTGGFSFSSSIESTDTCPPTAQWDRVGCKVAPAFTTTLPPTTTPAPPTTTPQTTTTPPVQTTTPSTQPPPTTTPSTQSRGRQSLIPGSRIPDFVLN